MSIIGILKIMEVQEDDMEVQEEAVLVKMQLLNFFTWPHNHAAATFYMQTLLIEKVFPFTIFFFQSFDFFLKSN